MKVLAFDISKKSTGVAYYDGGFDGLEAIQFKNSVQWGNKVVDLLELWSPDVVTFSETVNRMCSHTTKRIMFGLMYHLEHITFKRGITIIPINDTKAKHTIGVKMKNRVQIKADTINWANQFDKVELDDIADAMCFAHYIYYATNE